MPKIQPLVAVDPNLINDIVRVWIKYYIVHGQPRTDIQIKYYRKSLNNNTAILNAIQWLEIKIFGKINQSNNLRYRVDLLLRKMRLL